MHTGTIDLRSDTVTLPTPEMRKAMFEAEVGDDVYKEDPTVNKLEEFASEVFDKEASLFFPTGTMANQAAVMAHTGRGDEIIVEEFSHIYLYEVGGLSAISGIHPRSIASSKGTLSPEAVEKVIRPENIHFPRTALICLENTHNMHGGTTITKENIDEIARLANNYNIPIHLDGARIFNAAVALNTCVKELTSNCDSVMFCLSKGLAAPAGSLLVGTKEFISKARKCRKLLGGGMRQAGIIAAAGIVSLNQMTERLYEDHANASFLAEGLAQIKDIELDVKNVQSNIIRFKIKDTPVSDIELKHQLEKEGVKIQHNGKNQFRAVTHKDISREDIEKVLDLFNKIMKL